MRQDGQVNVVSVTDRVWAALLALRDGAATLPPRGWEAGELAAWELYAPVAVRDGRPRLVAQIGQSLDGRVATVSGDARDVSGPDGLVHLHRIRALVDAVVVGVRTALHDQPRLTVRLVSGPNPARVVIDPQGRLPDDAPVLVADGARRVVIQSVERPRPEGVEVIRLPGRAGWIRTADIATALAAEGLGNALIEGGGISIAGFLDAGLLDRLHIAVAPLIIGAGPSSLTTAPVERLSQARRPETRVYALGSDILFDCDVSPGSASRSQCPMTAEEFSAAAKRA